MQKVIENNDVVSIKYEVKDVKTSEIIDSNMQESDNLVFMIGKNQVIKGLEDKIVGMKCGEKADIFVKDVDAYGEYNPEAEQLVPIEQFAGIELEIGMPLYGQSDDGETIAVVVKDLNEATVLIDYNHPLAGKDLMFSVEIVDVREASEDEISSGHVGEDDCGCGTGCGCH
jgi:FKBP-type peptidyl-prolyl cis-trans isomerase SlyD